jgi:hypothetical protein
VASALALELTGPRDADDRISLICQPRKDGDPVSLAEIDRHRALARRGKGKGRGQLLAASASRRRAAGRFDEHDVSAKVSEEPAAIRQRATAEVKDPDRAEEPGH